MRPGPSLPLAPPAAQEGGGRPARPGNAGQRSHVAAARPDPRARPAAEDPGQGQVPGGRVMRYGYYPGCSLTHSAAPYDLSAQAVAAAFGMQLEELEDWNCCGATEYITINKTDRK